MRVFADTSYWIAVLNPRDALHSRAVSVTRNLGEPQLVTTEMVLVEVLNSFSGAGLVVRTTVAHAAQALRRNPSVVIEPQTTAQFEIGLQRYAHTADKEWSLTDCVSFHIMDEDNIHSALTHDRHFAQAGYAVLLR